MTAKHDLTASTRMAEWRNRMKAEGWRTFNIWLPAEAAEALDEIINESTDTRRNTLTKVLQAGIEAMAKHNAVASAESEQETAPVPTIDPVTGMAADETRQQVLAIYQEQATSVLAAGGSLEAARERVTELDGDHPNLWTLERVCALIGQIYAPPARDLLLEQGQYLYDRGLSYQAIARSWNAQGFKPETGKKWSGKQIESFLA